MTLHKKKLKKYKILTKQKKKLLKTKQKTQISKNPKNS